MCQGTYKPVHLILMYKEGLLCRPARAKFYVDFISLKAEPGTASLGLLPGLPQHVMLGFANSAGHGRASIGFDIEKAG